MNTKTKDAQKMGRPPLYNDPVKFEVRMERSTLDWLLEKYNGASKSRAVALELERSRAKESE